MLESLLMAAGVVIVACAAVVAFAATRPDSFRVARTARIAASPEQVFAQINNLRAMNAWNPFNKAPDLGGNYSGPVSGVGAHYDFDSKRAGTGHIEIVESKAPGQITMRLVMTKPMACDNRIDFTVVSRGGESEVTWAMTGKSSLMGKVCGLFFNMDKMCGGMFEKGLADLKTIAEPRQAA